MYLRGKRNWENEKERRQERKTEWERERANSYYSITQSIYQTDLSGFSNNNLVHYINNQFSFFSFGNLPSEIRLGTISQRKENHIDEPKICRISNVMLSSNCYNMV